MKTLVVYYSLEGNTRAVAGAIASAVGADILELKPEKDMNPKGFMKFVWGGRQVVMGKEPKLTPLSFDAANYDLLFIGTPVWAFSYAPALRTFMKNVPLNGKKVGLFCCHGGGKGAVFRKLREALDGNTILGELDFVEPIRTDLTAAKSKADSWARRMAADASA